MGDSSGLFVDPEEDEIFFYEVTDKEVQLKCSLGDKAIDLDTSGNCDSCLDQNHFESRSHENNLEAENVEKKPEDLESMSSFMLSSLYLSLPAANPTGVSTKDLEKSVFSNLPTLDQEIISFECKGQTDQNSLSESKRVDNLELSCNRINVYVDHNYSTPVKSIIDRSILKTPKSVVKADKDGGFLKVLSEIALVKAEADENTLKEAQKFSDTVCIEENTNDDNKENEQSDCEANKSIIKLIEFTPLKGQDPAEIKAFTSESLKKKFSNKNPYKLEEDVNLLEFSISEGEPTQEVKQEGLDNGIECLDNVSKDNTTCISDELCLIKTLSIEEKNLEDSNELKVVFERVHPKSTDNEPKSVSQLNTSHNCEIIHLDDAVCEPSLEHQEAIQEESSLYSDNNIVAKAMHRELTIDTSEKKQASALNEEDDCFVISEISQKEMQRRYLRRNTMRLLEELNDIVCSEQAKKESCEFQVNNMLSKEAAKVIEKLKTVGIDDSICSPDQYLDLDGFNTSFLGTEFSDILNETLSRPINTLTNKDIEALLEKITCNGLESKTEPASRMVDAIDGGKENKCKSKSGNNSNKVTGTPNIVFHSQNSGKTPVTLNKKTPIHGAPARYKTEKQIGVGSETKKSTKGVLQQPQTIQNNFKGSKSVEKNLRSNASTRIPKLASASKIPVNSKQVKEQNVKSTTYRTPLLKAQKNLKFNNIESPVQAYINSKTPVLLSNVRGKSESAFQVWMKHGTSNSKPEKPEVKCKQPTSETKPVLPFVKYKSAIPLKLEKSPESRLPRLAPKLQKLIGPHSPVIAKHEGRIQLSAPRRPQISMNDTSVLMNPNEVSVVVRRVAQRNVK